jgi:hypothetical protein
MIDEVDLSDALAVGRIPDDELVSILGSIFPLSRWESGRRITYVHPERGDALDVVYSRRGEI